MVDHLKKMPNNQRHQTSLRAAGALDRSIMSVKTTGIVTGILASICIQGCATGPVRYKTLGRYEYATIEWTKRAHVVAKPVAAVAGVVTDVGIVCADTIFTPLATIPIAARGAFLGPCAASRDFSDHPVKESCCSLLFFPFWFPPAYGLSLYWQTYQAPGPPYFDAFYPDTWGDESTLFKENPIKRNEIEPGDTPNTNSPSAHGVGGR